MRREAPAHSRRVRDYEPLAFLEHAHARAHNTGSNAMPSTILAARRRPAGFTILELLVVIAILGPSLPPRSFHGSRGSVRRS
jgi:prepilin-type N-terminal cleavage/methylation domain-containing protein